MYSKVFLYLFFYVYIFLIKDICQQIKLNINNNFTISKQINLNNRPNSNFSLLQYKFLVLMLSFLILIFSPCFTLTNLALAISDKESAKIIST